MSILSRVGRHLRAHRLRPALRVLALLAMLPALPAHAVADLSVAVGAPACDAPDAKNRPTFRYTLSWAAGTAGPRQFDVYTGNACVLSGPTCGGKTCVQCAGTCRVELRSCQFDNRQWMRVVSRDRLVATERITVSGGDRKACQ